MITATKRFKIKNEVPTKNEMKNGYAMLDPQPSGFPASSDFGSHFTDGSSKHDNIISNDKYVIWYKNLIKTFNKRIRNRTDINCKIYLAKLLQWQIGTIPKAIVGMIESSYSDELMYLHPMQYAQKSISKIIISWTR